MTDTALIAGAGVLPARLAAAMPARPLVAALEGFEPSGITPDLQFRVERLIPFLDHLCDQGITRVCFAGAVRRPRLDPSLFDAQTARIVPRLLAAMQRGDDATLREVLALFEEAGLTIVGVEDLAPALVPGAGVICGTPGPRDEADATRAAAIVAALGSVDVGQGCVVQQGLCLGVEAIPGTDAMLRGVAQIPLTLRPDAGQGRGLFYKAPKPGQDRRVDLPALGPETVDRAADAGLGGMVWQAGGVIVLDLPVMTARATAQGLFLWARA
ncbi:LpxI family protein [Szabonella alba]|uniref:UDP-2,3-diacylglucosamine diphosphatase LpxI n=1 Tax=Szabonella alba TaxID=2804194 RepID=A0A8K0VGT7_9RHOB|nr:UDP-2,3-diacylglucosamine diphosphatase LpxI [Szabonella alba]MBL4919152.1 UDP-2,3-diacylglucosamine diphosphatase LpxI [Szabonella alba]